MAFVEKYVTVTGGGLHDGSSEANAWTLTEAASNISAGDRINMKAGTYVISGAMVFSGLGSSTSPSSLRQVHRLCVGTKPLSVTWMKVRPRNVLAELIFR
jgi:hypothetical protein